MPSREDFLIKFKAQLDDAGLQRQIQALMKEHLIKVGIDTENMGKSMKDAFRSVEWAVQKTVRVAGDEFKKLGGTVDQIKLGEKIADSTDKANEEIKTSAKETASSFREQYATIDNELKKHIISFGEFSTELSRMNAETFGAGKTESERVAWLKYDAQAYQAGQKDIISQWRAYYDQLTLLRNNDEIDNREYAQQIVSGLEQAFHQQPRFMDEIVKYNNIARNAMLQADRQYAAEQKKLSQDHIANFKEEYAKLKVLHDNNLDGGLANERSYYEGVGALADKYYANQKQYATEYAKYHRESVEGLAKVERQEKSLISTTNEVAQSWKNAIEYFVKYKILYEGLQLIKQAAREVVENVVELNGALTEFAKVSDLSGKSLDAFVAKAYKAGEATARTGKEMIEASTEFVKAGYTETEALNLAKFSTLYQNIADEQVSVGDATGFIISQLKAFNMEASQSQHIIDAVNEVANKYAVSSADLATNIGKASSALAMSGDSYEQILGLMTAGTEITQNGSRIANMLKVVSQRMRGVGEDAEDTTKEVSGLQKAFDQYGIDVQIANKETGELASTYEIFAGVADKWETLTDVQRQSLAEMMAGKNRISDAVAVITNFNTAIDATATAYNSAGSAMRENGTYMDSIQGKMSALTAQWELFSAETLPQDTIKWFIDAATATLKFTREIGGLKTVLAGLATILLALKGDAIISLFKQSGTLIKEFIGQFTALKTLSKQTGVSMFKSFTMAAGGAMTLQAALAGVALVLTVAVALWSKHQSDVAANAQAMRDNADAAVSSANSLTGLVTKYNELANESDKTDTTRQEMVGTSKQIAEALSVEKDKVDDLVDAYGNLTKSAYEQIGTNLKEQLTAIYGGVVQSEKDIRDAFTGMYGLMTTGAGNASAEFAKNIKENVDIIDGFASSIDGLFGIGGSGGVTFPMIDSIEEARTQLKDLSNILEYATQNYTSEQLAGIDLYTQLYNRYSKLNDLLQTHDEYVSKSNDLYMQSYVIANNAAASAISSVPQLEAFAHQMASSMVEFGNFTGTLDEAYKEAYNFVTTSPLLQAVTAAFNTQIENTKSLHGQYAQLVLDSQQTTNEIQTLNSVMEWLADGTMTWGEAVDRLTASGMDKYLTKTASGFEWNVDALTGLISKGKKFTGTWEDVINGLKEAGDLKGETNAFNQLSKGLEKLFENARIAAGDFEYFTDQLADIDDKYDILSKAQDELTESGALTYDTFKQMSDNNLLQYLTDVDGKTVIAAGSLDEMRDALINNAIAAEVNAGIAQMNAIAQDALGASASGAGSSASGAAGGLISSASAMASVSTSALDAASSIDGLTASYNSLMGMTAGVANAVAVQQQITAVYDNTKGVVNQLLALRTTLSPSGGSKRKSGGGGGGGGGKKSGGGGGGGKKGKSGGSSKSSADKAKDAFDSAFKELEYQRDKDLISEDEYYNQLGKLNDKYFKGKKDNLDDYRKYEIEIYEYLKKKEEERLDARLSLYEMFIDRKTKALDKEIDKLNEARDAEEKRLDAEREQYEATLAVYEAFADKQVAAIDEQIAAIEAERDAQEETNNELQRAVDLQEKLDALAKAKQTRIRVFKEGEYVYEQDYESIAAAQKDLSDFQESIRQEDVSAAYDKQISALQEQQNKWSSWISDFQAQQELAENELKAGVKLSDLLASQELSNLDMFSKMYTGIYTSYKSVTDKTLDDIDAKIEAYEKERDAWKDFVDDYKDQLDLLDTEQKAGVTLEKLVLDERLDNFQSFVTAYIAASNKLRQATAETGVTPGVPNIDVSKYGATASGANIDFSGTDSVVFETLAANPAVASASTVSGDTFNLEGVTVVANNAQEFIASLQDLKSTAAQYAAKR